MSAPSSLLQGLTLLEAAIAQERSGRHGHNASRLAELTTIERSRVSRLTRELRDLGFLLRDETTAFSAGPAYLQLAGNLGRSWLRPARSELRILAARLGMSAQIVAPNGPGAVTLRVEHGSGIAADTATRGLVTPIWCTGGGRALLWDHSEAGLAELLSGVQLVGVGGSGAARSLEELQALLERDRRTGIVHARDEYIEGTHEYALPIRDGDEIVAAVAVTGPEQAPQRARRARSELEAVCAQLSELVQGSRPTADSAVA